MWYDIPIYVVYIVNQGSLAKLTFIFSPHLFFARDQSQRLMHAS